MLQMQYPFSGHFAEYLMVSILKGRWDKTI